MSTGSGSFGIAVNAPASGECAVAVWAVEPGVDGDLVDPATKQRSKVGVQVPVWFFVHGDPVLDLDIPAII
jgi:hypothetical protein